MSSVPFPSIVGPIYSCFPGGNKASLVGNNGGKFSACAGIGGGPKSLLIAVSIAGKGCWVVRSNVAQGVDAPSRFLAPRDRRGSASYFIGLQKVLASYNAIERRIGSPTCAGAPIALSRGVLGAPVRCCHIIRVGKFSLHTTA
jgi:hypothetical protein